MKISRRQVTLGPQAKQEIHFRSKELIQLSSKYANDIQFNFFFYKKEKFSLETKISEK